MPNLFHLLSQDDEEGAAFQELAINQAPSLVPGGKPAAVVAPVQNTTPAANGRSNNAAPRGRPETAQRGGNRRNPGAQGEPEAELQKDSRTRGGKSQGSGQARGPRGGRGGRGSGGNRQFDRHSMTGKTDSDKQIEQGWGIGDNGKRELEAEVNGEADAQAEASGVATPVPEADAAADAVPAKEETPAPPARVPEPEDNTVTYEQYLANREKSGALAERLGLSSNIRKPNEGSDDAQWKDAVAREKNQDDETYFVGKQDENKTRKRVQKEAKQFIEIEPRYPRPSSDRGGERGRGGRGRGGERGGRGAPRGGNSNGASRGRGGSRNAAAPNVDTSDVNAFPSLS